MQGAKLIIKNAPQMTEYDAEVIAAWLRKQAEKIESTAFLSEPNYEYTTTIVLNSEIAD